MLPTVAELKDFIRQTLFEISEGLREANEVRMKEDSEIFGIATVRPGKCTAEVPTASLAKCIGWP